MAFGGLAETDSALPMAEINMIPLIDVMLVLLIIFIVTAPLLTHSVRVNLPKASAQVNVEKPETVTISIDASGRYFWNAAAIEPAVLRVRLAEVASRDPQPALHLRAEHSTPYERVAQVMAAAQRSGLERIGFITQPERP